MYDSSVTAHELVTSVAATVNVACELDREFYLGVLSKLEQLLYAEYICGDILPARSCVEVAALPKGGLVEIEVIALRK